MQPLRAVLPQLSRYSLASLLALALDFAVYLLLTGAGMKAPPAGVIGYGAGLMLHYWLSVRFVFEVAGANKVHARLFAEFALCGLVGMLVTGLVIAIASGVTGLGVLPAKLLATAVSFIIVFELRRALVFSVRAERSPLLRRLVRSDLMAGVGRFALPSPGADFYARFTVAGLALFVSVELAYFLFSNPPSFYLPTVDGFGGTAIGRDFLNTWMGGRSALAEGPAAWFDFEAYNDLLRSLVGVKESYFWSYPPHVLLFIWPFGLMPYLPAFALWSVLGLVLFLYAASAGGVERKHLLFVAVAPAVAINAIVGQNGCFTAALLIGGLFNLERRPVLSGVLFGILTIKPQLGLLLPLMLVVTGRWRAIMAAAITVAALVSATLWLYGAETWMAYFKEVVPQQRYLQEYGDGLLFLQIPSAFYAARLVGLPLTLAWSVQAMVSTCAAAAIVWTFWRRREPTLSLALLVVASFLATPYAMNYDLVVLAWVLALLRQSQDNAPLDHYMIVAVWTLPVTMMLAGWIHVPLAMPLLAAFAARLLWRLAQGEARQRTEGTLHPAEASLARPRD